MGRKFNFFDWATGKSSGSKKDFRRLVILLGCTIGVVGLVVIVRMFFSENGVEGEHTHEKGPHGGIVVVIDKADHYHAEVLVEDDGRIQLFFYGKDTAQPVEVSPQLLTGKARKKGGDGSTSLILRPAGKPGEARRTTSHFVGRLSPELLENHLSVSIGEVSIQGHSLTFQFNLPDSPDGKKRALESEKALVINPKGKYTRADVAAMGKNLPSEQFKGIKVVHSLRKSVGDVVCPVTRAKADTRITWQVNGQIYQFCCSPCITEFVNWAQEYPESIVAPEDLVIKN